MWYICSAVKERGIFVEKHREYTGIDLFKLIFSFFVVFIHCHPRDDLVSFVVANGIGRLAVPFFFCAAGFFLAKKTLYAPKELYKKNQKSFLWRILKMYLIWSAVYLPLMLVALRIGSGFDWATCFKEYLQGLFFTGSYYHLWYLPALCVGGALVSALAKKLDVRVIFLLGLILYVVGIFNEAYSGICPPGLSYFYEKIYNPVFERTRNGLFFAPIFFSMGYLFAAKDAKERFGIGKSNKTKNLILTIVFTALVCAEAVLLEQHDIPGGRYGMYITVIPATRYCFAFARELELPWSENRAYFLRKISTAVYLVHYFVYSIVVVTLMDTLWGFDEVSRLWKYLLVMILTLLLAWLMVRLGKKKSSVGRFFRSLC